MKTLGILLIHWDCFGIDHTWYWPFPFFFFFMFLFIMFFFFRGWRRRNYSGRWRGWCGCGDYKHNDAKDILKKRYANGEISKEEYDKISKDIFK